MPRRPAAGPPAVPPTDPPANPGPDLAQLRLNCYPPVPLSELRPRRPEPPGADVTAAMGDVPVALTQSRFGGPSLHLPADPSEHRLEHPAWLAFAQERGHGRAAAEWAIYRLAEAGQLCVVWPRVNQLARPGNVIEANEAQARRYRGDRAATVGDWDLFEDGRVLEIRSTPALWDWWRKGENPPTDAQRQADPAAGKQQSPGAKGKNINAKMLDMLSKDHTHYEWSARQIAEHLSCGEGTVKGTPAWEQIMAYRAARYAERLGATGTFNGRRRKRD